MTVSRKADTDQGDAIPLTLVAVRRSLRAFRRFLVVGAIAFVAVPVAMFAAFDDTPLQFLPLSITIGGLIWLRFESLKLERELRRARVRALDAIDLERIRIQRDLHDSAQQRLVSVRIHAGLLAQSASTAEDREAMEQLGRDLDAALADIRNVTRDGSPELLLRNGIVASIRSAAAHASLKVTIEARNVGSYAPHIERGIYFCCLEALQNAVKHAARRPPSTFAWSASPTASRSRSTTTASASTRRASRTASDWCTSRTGSTSWAASSRSIPIPGWAPDPRRDPRRRRPRRSSRGGDRGRLIGRQRLPHSRAPRRPCLAGGRHRRRGASGDLPGRYGLGDCSEERSQVRRAAAPELPMTGSGRPPRARTNAGSPSPGRTSPGRQQYVS